MFCWGWWRFGRFAEGLRAERDLLHKIFAPAFWKFGSRFGMSGFRGFYVGVAENPRYVRDFRSSVSVIVSAQMPSSSAVETAWTRWGGAERYILYLNFVCHKRILYVFREKISPSILARGKRFVYFRGHRDRRRQPPRPLSAICPPKTSSRFRTDLSPEDFFM